MWQKVGQLKYVWLVLLVAAVLLIWQFTSYRPGGRVQEDDYLIYKMKGALFLYTPYTNRHRPILMGWKIDSFTLKNDRLAFSFNNNVYVLEYPFINSPQQITPDEYDRAYPDSWSPDGRYLAYETIHQDMITLWLWDHTQQQATAIYLYPKALGGGSGSSWGPQGQFAFTRDYGFVSGKSRTGGTVEEVLIWDGQHILNLSQDDKSHDMFPVWSSDGRLAFLSGQGDIFVWDGVSKKDGLPDKSSFINVASYLTHYTSYPHWSYSGMLTFQGKTSEIYQWDGSTVSNLSNNPGYTNVGYSWSRDGYWAFMTSTFSSKDDQLFVRNQANETVFAAEWQNAPGWSEPAWSEHGLLAFCTYNRSVKKLGITNWDNFLANLWAGHTLEQAYIRASIRMSSSSWQLSMWAGDQTAVQIVEGKNIQVIWSNGESTYCTSG